MIGSVVNDCRYVGCCVDCVGVVAFGDLVGGGLYGVFVLGVGFVSGLNVVAALIRSEVFLSSPHSVGIEPRILMLLLMKSKQFSRSIGHFMLR